MKIFTIRHLAGIWLLILAWGLLSCDEEENNSVDSAPSIELTKPEIEAFPNTIFTISASITDEAGVKSIHLENENWLLNKTILPAGNPKEYELRYKFKVPASENINSSHEVTVTVINVGNKVTEVVVPVTLTLDVTAPSINLTSPINSGSYIIKSEEGVAEFSIKMLLSDDKELKTLNLKSTVLGLDETVDLSGTEVMYSKDIDFNTPGSYEITLTTTDATGNTTTVTRQVKLIEALQFDNMYLTDVFTTEALTSDLFGVPQLMISSNDGDEAGYVFSTRYYASGPGTEIKFIPQATAFDPFAFGESSDIAGGLELGNGSDPIVLPAKGYYEISIDLRTMKYSATAYTPSDVLQSEMYMAGRGYDGQNWDPSVATAMTRNSDNPYEFSLTTSLYYEESGSPASVQWIFIHSRSWNLPYWRFNSAVPTKVIPSINSDLGGTNVNIVVPIPTNYKITFDYHLNTIKAVKQ